MATNSMHFGFDLASWTKLAKIGSSNAVSGLSQMVNQEIKVTTLDLQEVSLQNAARLIGEANDPVIGVYLLFSGSTDGQILLAFQPRVAFELVDMAMGIPLGSTQSLGEIEHSVLGEVGNIVGSFFLNGVADYAEICLKPTPPAVVEDMAGELISSDIAEAHGENDTTFVLR